MNIVLTKEEWAEIYAALEFSQTDIETGVKDGIYDDDKENKQRVMAIQGLKEKIEENRQSERDKTSTYPVCTECGSDDVLFDAYAIWNKDTQAFEAAE
jgi:hypothetical protein